MQSSETMRNPKILFSRREMIRQSAQATAWLAFAANCAPLLAAPETRRFKLGACDWSIGKMGDPAAFEVAKQIGLDGVQVSLGTVADDLHLRKSEVQQKYAPAKCTGIIAFVRGVIASSINWAFIFKVP